MPVKYTFEQNILKMTFDGVYGSEAIIQSFNEALEDPAFPGENARLLLDVRGSDSLADRSVEDLRKVAEHYARNADRVGRRCAIVAQSDIHFGLMRMAVAFTETYDADARVFKSEDEAVDWLNKSPSITYE
ncbi:MAG: STAS/SEC14 domain-containing protein [Candidatus Latescibacterota bacterium]|jgi:hypothetical protein